MKVKEHLFRGMSGCSNHDCVITGPKQGGMGTNGQCKCVINMSRSQLNILQSRIAAIAEREVKSND